MKRFDWRGLAIACCLVALVTTSIPHVRASVDLSEITATALADGTIKVRWVTATELNTAAFQLYRSFSATTPWGQWTAIGPQIAARGDAVTGATYEHIDSSNLTPGTTYYYLLEELENDGVTRKQYTNYIRSATAITSGGPTFTPTPTATRTLTPTLTRAATDTPGDPPTATRQFTNTPVVGTPRPTATPAPGQPTATAAAAASPTPILTPRLATPTGQAGVTPAAPLPTATRPATAIAAATTAAPTATATRAVATTVAPTFTPPVTASPAVFTAKGTAEPVLRETPARSGSSSTPAEGAQRNEGWALAAGGIAVALAAVLGAAAIILWRRRQS